MLLELLILLTSGLLVAIVALVAFDIASCRLALIRFNKLSRGLPILPGAKLLGNHAHNVFLGNQVCQKLRGYHERLGPTIGFIKNDVLCVSTVDLDLIKTFIVDEPKDHLSRFDSINIPVHELRNSLAALPARQWFRLRKAIVPALTPNKFKTPNVQREIEDSIEKVVGLIESRINTGDVVLAANDFLARYSGYLIFKCFYKQDDLVDFEAERDEGLHQLDLVCSTFKDDWLPYIVTVCPQLMKLVEFVANRFATLGAVLNKFRNFIDQQIRIRQAASEQWPELKRAADERGDPIDPQDFVLKDGTRYRRNMLDHLIDQFFEGKLTREDLSNNNLFLMAAGFRTASDCLIHTSYLLSIHQDVQDKARASIMVDGIESEYLEWVLLESLRLLPPAPIGCSRVITRDIELESGHIVPKGTFVLTNAYVIHRLKEYWGEDADEFRPDRWRDTSHHHPVQFLAFGAGLRGCAGRQFALHEMKMLLVALLARYKFIGEPRDDAYEFSTPNFAFVVPNSETRIRIKPIETR